MSVKTLGWGTQPERSSSAARRYAGGCAKALLAMLAALVFSPAAARACAVCYGEPDSPASRGLTWAIVALGLLVVGVLGGVVAFFVHMNRKAALLPLPGGAPTLATAD